MLIHAAYQHSCVLKVFWDHWCAGQSLSGEANINFGAPLLLKLVPWTNAIICRGLRIGNILSSHFQINSP